MHSFCRSETSEILTVEADTIITDQVGIFFSLYAICREINKLVGFIYPEDITYVPFAFGYLMNRLGCGAIIHIQMIPVVTFTHPYHPFSILQVVAEMAGIIDVFITCFFY